MRAKAEPEAKVEPEAPLKPEAPAKPEAKEKAEPVVAKGEPIVAGTEPVEPVRGESEAAPGQTIDPAVEAKAQEPAPDRVFCGTALMGRASPLTNEGRSGRPPSWGTMRENTGQTDTGQTDTGVMTFLIAELRGDSRYTDEFGDEAAARLANKFVALVEEGVEAHGGLLSSRAEGTKDSPYSRPPARQSGQPLTSRRGSPRRPTRTRACR